MVIGLLALALPLAIACDRSLEPDSSEGDRAAVNAQELEADVEAPSPISDSPTVVAPSDSLASLPPDVSVSPFPTPTVRPTASPAQERPRPTTVEPTAQPSPDASTEDASGAAMSFTDVTADAGIDYAHVPLRRLFNFAWPGWIAGGAVAEDFDGDGWIDLFILRGAASPALLYMNQGDGTFANEAAPRGAALSTQWGMAAAAADFDNDGDIDIVVTNYMAPHLLLVNLGTGHFESIDTMLLAPSIFVTSPSWGDVDNDGLLELAIGEWAELDTVGQAPGEPLSALDFPYRLLWLYKNKGEGVLEPYQFRTAASDDTDVFAPRFADINGDRLADLTVVSDFNNSQLYLNVGNGKFKNVTATHGIGAEEHGMGSAIGDYDNDGDLDWFVSSILDDSGNMGDKGSVGNRLYRNKGDGSFEDATEGAGVVDGNWGWGASFGDLDNDGDLDLYHVNGWPPPEAEIAELFNDQPARLFQNLGDGTFEDVAASVGADDRGQGRGVILFDYDNDGDLDIFITNNQVLEHDGGSDLRRPGRPVLLRNDTGNGYHWLKVTLEGRPPFHRNGIGSRVYVTAGGRTQMRELHASSNFLTQEPGRIAHFGLGEASVVEEVRAEWVSGDATVMTDVAVDQAISVPGPTGTASPVGP